jgi:hypothetical protein
LSVKFRLIHVWLGRPLAQVDGRLHQPPPGPDDHGVTRAQVFLGAVNDGSHALSDGLILQMDTIDAREALGALHFAVDAIVVRRVGSEPSLAQPVRGVGQELWPTH